MLKKTQILNVMTMSLAVAGFASGAFADHKKGHMDDKAACTGDCSKDEHKDCDCKEKGVKCNCKHKHGEKHEAKGEEKKAEPAHK